MQKSRKTTKTIDNLELPYDISLDTKYGKVSA